MSSNFPPEPEYDSPGSFDPSEMFASLAAAPLEPMDSIAFAGCRQNPVRLTIKRDNQFSADRDAIMLHALLSTSLDANTWDQFVSLILAQNSGKIMDNILKQLAREGAAPVPKLDFQPRPKKKTKAKEDVDVQED